MIVMAAGALAVARSVVPVQEEPHHTPVFENAWVRVLDVRFPAGAESLHHRHALHNVAVRIVGGTTRADPVGGQGVPRYSPTGSVVFHSASPPYVHRVVNVGTAPVHIVDVELPGARPASDIRAADDLARHVVEIDNAHVRVSRVRPPSGESLPAHTHQRGWLHLVVTGLQPGAFSWHEAGHQLSIAAPATPIELVEIRAEVTAVRAAAAPRPGAAATAASSSCSVEIDRTPGWWGCRADACRRSPASPSSRPP